MITHRFISRSTKFLNGHYIYLRFISLPQSTISKSEGGHVAIAIICIVIGALAGLLAAVDVFMLVRIHRMYRSRDGVSMEKARQEAVTGLMSNKNVRDTVVDVGASVATSAATRN